MTGQAWRPDSSGRRGDLDSTLFALRRYAEAVKTSSEWVRAETIAATRVGPCWCEEWV